MENRSFYNEILTEHNVRPEFKHDMEDADIVLEGVNPSCGDDIFLKLKTDGDTIVDGAFVGDGCAISQASADIMLGIVIGIPAMILAGPLFGKFAGSKFFCDVPSSYLENEKESQEKENGKKQKFALIVSSFFRTLESEKYLETL